VDHFRNNLSKLGEKHRAFAIDLLGYGYSSKPDPRKAEVNSIYNFATWSDQLLDFIDDKIGERTCLTCNSVGGIAGLEAAIKAPEKITSVQVMNISLRMLHIEKQPKLLKPFVSLLQKTLRTSALGPLFFKQIATKDGVRNVLRQCYSDPSAVTDELVDIILNPGLEHGAVDVFLDFISYSGGPLPEKQLEKCPVPVSVVWGEDDPWEKIEWGREFVHYPSVEEFISIPNTGHCPMDENPDAVNPIIESWAARHS
jgi:pimeloyl-ACP methyl ester carboxylesterase